MTATTVLFTSAGRRVGLINCFRDGARRLGIDLRVIAGDLKPDLSAACAAADAAFAVPRATDPGYIDAIADLCAAEGADLLIPTIDPELLPLAEAAERFEAAGTRINISSPEVVRVARDKLETARVLKSAGVKVPRGAAFGDPSIGGDALPYPLIAKPRDGSSSVGLHLLDGPADLAALGSGTGYLIQERLAGPEFTVNIFVGTDGTLKAAVPHRRIETRGGEVSKGRTERNDAIALTVQQMVAGLPGLRGVLCIQCFLTESGPVVFEINARFGGGYPLAHAAGARFAQWLLEERLGLPSTAADDWADQMLMLRYDAEIFL